MTKNVDDINFQKPGWFYFFVKRFFDFFLSLLGIIILSWLFILVGLIVLVSSGFPMIFKDKRVGKNGKDFSVFKFRTMRKNADANIEKYLTKEQLELWQKERKIEKDPRITPFGRLIRKLSIDELPQFFNILIGSMSIIGPRPITRLELDAHYSEEEKKILLSARPGLISNWSLNGRSNVKFDSGLRQKYELEYFKKRSIWKEIKMFFKVIPVVISGKGAK